MHARIDIEKSLGDLKDLADVPGLRISTINVTQDKNFCEGKIKLWSVHTRA